MPSASADASGDRPTTRSTPRAARRAARALVVGSLALSLAGCFGSSSSSSNLPGADPASVVPTSTLAYAQAVIRPTGTLARDINAASERLLGIANPGAQLDALIDKSAPGGLSYEKNIRPWLGARAGVALLSIGSGAHTEAVLVLDQTNDAKARAALSTHVLFQTNGKPDATTPGSYRGVSYIDDQTSHAVAGVVGQFVVIANNPAAFDATVDVEKGASSLASASSYQQSLGQTLTDSAGTAYADLGRLVALIPASGVSSSALSVVKSLVGNETLYGSARFDANGALLDLGSLDAPKARRRARPRPRRTRSAACPRIRGLRSARRMSGLPCSKASRHWRSSPAGGPSTCRSRSPRSSSRPGSTFKLISVRSRRPASSSTALAPRRRKLHSSSGSPTRREPRRSSVRSTSSRR